MKDNSTVKYWEFPYGLWLPEKNDRLIEQIKRYVDVMPQDHMHDILYINGRRVRTPHESGSHPCYGCGQYIDKGLFRCSNKKCDRLLKKNNCCVGSGYNTRTWIHDIDKSLVLTKTRKGVVYKFAFCHTCHKKIEWLGDYDQSFHIVEFMHFKKQIHNVSNSTSRSIPNRIRHMLFKKADYKCQDCGATKDETKLEIDHIIPWSRGGQSVISNLQVLCKQCNRGKYTSLWKAGQ